MGDNFVRQDSKKFKKIQKPAWRRPKGRQSKQRRKKKHAPDMPSIGYGKPKKSQYVVINSLKDIGLLKEGSDVIISSHLGLKKIAENMGQLERFNVINKEKIAKTRAKQKEQEMKKEKEKSEKKKQEKAEKKEEEKEQPAKEAPKEEKKEGQEEKEEPEVKEPEKAEQKEKEPEKEEEQKPEKKKLNPKTGVVEENKGE